MARDHYIPCFLLSKFSKDPSRGRKSLVYQFLVSGARPNRPVKAEDLAFSKTFYDIEQPSSSLDDAGLRESERRASDAINAIIDGAEPETYCEVLGELFSVQSSRTRAFRDGTANAAYAGLTELQERICSGNSDSVVTALMREFVKSMSTAEIEESLLPVARQFGLDQLSSEQLRQALLASSSLRVSLHGLRRMLSSLDLSSIATKGTTNAQIEGLHELVEKRDLSPKLRSVRLCNRDHG